MSDKLPYIKVDGDHPTEIVFGEYRISIDKFKRKSYIKVDKIPLVEQERFKKFPTWLQDNIREHGDKIENCPEICPYETICSGACFYL